MKNKMKKNIQSLLLGFFVYAMSVRPTFAANIINPLKFDNIWAEAGSLIPVAVGGVGIALLGYLLYGAYLWMSAADQPDKVEGAKKTLTNAVMGFALFGIMFGLFLFLTFILNINWASIIGRAI